MMTYQLLIGITCRTLLAMFIGGLIGWERESTHRPAGLRTHMLVSIGACVIMQLGDYAATQTGIGISIDPSRLGSQVISGIGFLGAGTIMKEGATIKGLTTAASLWVVACLGLTIGSGAYAIAIIGFIAVILTLMVFEHASTFLPFGKYRRFSIKIQCGDLRQTLQHLNNVAKKYQGRILDLELVVLDDEITEISFNFSTNQLHRTLDSTTLFEDMEQYKEINSIKMTEY